MAPMITLYILGGCVAAAAVLFIVMIVLTALRPPELPDVSIEPPAALERVLRALTPLPFAGSTHAPAIAPAAARTITPPAVAPPSNTPPPRRPLPGVAPYFTPAQPFVAASTSTPRAPAPPAIAQSPRSKPHAAPSSPEPHGPRVAPQPATATSAPAAPAEPGTSPATPPSPRLAPHAFLAPQRVAAPPVAPAPHVAAPPMTPQPPRLPPHATTAPQGSVARAPRLAQASSSPATRAPRLAQASSSPVTQAPRLAQASSSPATRAPRLAAQAPRLPPQRAPSPRLVAHRGTSSSSRIQVPASPYLAPPRAAGPTRPPAAEHYKPVITPIGPARRRRGAEARADLASRPFNRPAYPGRRGGTLRRIVIGLFVTTTLAVGAAVAYPAMLDPLCDDYEWFGTDAVLVARDYARDANTAIADAVQASGVFEPVGISTAPR